MNICTSEQEFINAVAPYARRVCKRFGFYLPSVLIAQAAKELGYAIPAYWDNPGVRALVGENNMVGIKRDLLNKSWVDIGLSVWPGKWLNKDTPEVYGGVPVTVKADFRIYDNIEQSFADYLCFMRWGGYSVGNPKYYNDIKDVKDYRTLITIVHQKGYATGPTYASGVCSIIQKHSLTQYDDLTGVEPSDYYPGGQPESSIVINPNWAFEPTHNTSVRRGSIQYLYIHYVGGTGDAKANIEWYNTPTTTDGSADFYCGFAGDIWQYNMDIEHRYCWAVGGKRQSQYGGQFYGIAENANGISIEMCVRSKTGKAPKNPNDPNWYFEKATVDAAVKLAKYLMQKYNIPPERVIRHYDVNGKYCPGVIGFNAPSGSEAAWIDFKNRLNGVAPQPTPTPTPTPTGKVYRVQTGAYQRKGNADNRVAYIKDITRWSSLEAKKKGKQPVRSNGYDSFIEKGSDGMYRVFTGSYSVKDNAENRCNELIGAYEISSFILEV